MARQTRAQRRARREQQAASEPQAAPRSRARQLSVRSAPEPVASTAGRTSGGGTRRFVAESWGELKKVEWPGRTQVVTGTVVVIIACAIVGFYLWVNDLVWNWFVENVLLNR